MAIEGRLGPGGVADLLSALWQQERTGILDLSLKDGDRKLALLDGAIVYVVSADPGERLHVRLVQSGTVTKEQILAASKAGTDLRHELARRGVALEAHDAELAKLVEEVVLKIFQAREGKYQLVDRQELGLEGALEDLDMVPILWRGARSATPEFAQAYMGSLGQRVQKLGHEEVLQQLTDLSPQEGYLLSRIDGYSSAQDILGMSPLPPEDTLRFLLGLCVLGVIDVQGRPGLKLPRPAKPAPGKKTAKPAAKPGAKPAAGAKPPPTLVKLQSHAGTIPGLASAEPSAAPELPAEGIDAARALLAKIQSADHYQVLGLKQGATGDDVRKSYYALARAHHPDRYGRDVSAADRETVENLFSRISEAFGVLSDDEARAQYDERLKSGALQAQMEADRRPVDKKELGRESAAKGKALVAQGDKTRALAFLEHAVECDPESYDYRIALAQVLLSDTRSRKRAEPHLLAAIQIDQTKGDAYYHLGLLYKMAGVKSRAMEQFRAGLKWDGTHAGLLREMAEGDDDKPGDAQSGLLGGLFGKKK